MKSLLNLLNTTPKSVIVSMSAVAVLFLGFVDYLLGPEISFSIFYLFPIAIVSWFVGFKTGIVLSLISAIGWLLADLLAGHVYSSAPIPYWNALMRFGLFFIISWLLTEVQRYLEVIHKRRVQVVQERATTQTLQKLTTLLAENITAQNSEIIKWVEERRQNDQKVPEQVEKASNIIGSSLHVLTEMSFLAPYGKESDNGRTDYIETLKEKMEEIKQQYDQKPTAEIEQEH
ncbi:MAG: hypothetical protein GF372_04555 [Candidatus Marinimicrobia bacterium]|nr:hypothetical protein [Candidatus Neomarinimicrobiota bacterium]